jgi:D-alanyl-lipoteichoic acid acyltransferase DltB (MBOAT superfamily)
VALAAIAAQYLLIAGIVYTFRLETAGFLRLMALCGVGFVVHHLLPSRLRLPFFVLLSLGAIPVVLTPRLGVWLLASGWLLIGLCHLPVRLGVRVALIAVLAGLLAAARNGFVATLWPSALWPVFGSMFMFRLAVYLYDLEHKTAPFSFWRAGAYFFMAPNLCFPLFPVVDYKTFCRTHYNDDPFLIYQKGLDWLFRGVLQLLAYRWLYQHLVIDSADVVDAASAAQYVVTTFLLYLKVSGAFHVIVGLLHLFGFNLPETHHRYLLSSSFLDFWRRINIYWKDFLQKLVFYPLYFRIKHWGEKPALVTSTIVVFAVTWLLHSYQAFWLTGDFALPWQDGVFWTALTVLVLANLLWELRTGKQRRISETRPAAGAQLHLAGRTVGTFVVIALLWSLWSSETIDHWLLVMSAFGNLSVRGALLILGVLGSIALAVVWLGRSSSERAEGGQLRQSAGEPSFYAQPAFQTAGVSALVLAAGLYPASLDLLPAVAGTVRDLKEFQLNARDIDRMQRGYYEKLTHDVRFNPELWRTHHAKPADWVDTTNSKLIRGTDDFLGIEFKPSDSEVYQGALMTTNRWSMRDRDYAKAKDPGVYRMALLGASRSAGGGVEDHQTFEALIEDRLNRERRSNVDYRYEILNFSMMSYGPFRKLQVLETKVWDFQPDAVLFETQAGESMFAVFDLTRGLAGGHSPPYPELDPILKEAQRAGKDATDRNAIRTRLLSHRDTLLRLAFEKLARACHERGVPVFLLMIPDFGEPLGGRRAAPGVIALGLEQGFRVIDLRGMLRHMPKENALKLAPWDNHPNARGHRLIADRIYRGLRPKIPSRP